MSSRYVVIYDSLCRLCTEAVARLRAMPLRAEWEAVPLQSDAAASLLPPDYSLEQLQAELHVVDTHSGAIYRGADAIAHVMTLLPGFRFFAVLYRIPGVRPLAAAAYRAIAKRRYKLFGEAGGCDSGHCRLDGQSGGDRSSKRE